MTPEQRAKELYEGVLADCMNVTGQHAGCAGPAVHIEEAIRAALRERDARWLAATKRYIGDSGVYACDECCRLPWDEDRKTCDRCAPLRALLEEAGK